MDEELLLNKESKDLTFTLNELEKALEKYKGAYNKNEIIAELIEDE